MSIHTLLVGFLMPQQTTVDNELERMRKEAVVTWFQILSLNCPGGNEENYEHLIQYSGCPYPLPIVSQITLPHEPTCSSVSLMCHDASNANNS
jgi:hypothetical protein